MQNPRILQFLIENIDDQSIISAAKNKLKFIPLSESEIQINEYILEQSRLTPGIFSKNIVDSAFEKINKGGHYEVNNAEFLTGANISVAITKEFMDAVEADTSYDLRFPDVDNYSGDAKAAYDSDWMHVGDVREWEKLDKNSHTVYNEFLQNNLKVYLRGQKELPLDEVTMNKFLENDLFLNRIETRKRYPDFLNNLYKKEIPKL